MKHNEAIPESFGPSHTVNVDSFGGAITFGGDGQNIFDCKTNWVSYASDKKTWSLPLVK